MHRVQRGQGGVLPSHLWPMCSCFYYLVFLCQSLLIELSVVNYR